MSDNDLRKEIESALHRLATAPLREGAKDLLHTLGYQSERTLTLEGSRPQAFLDLIASQGDQGKFDPAKALFSDWKSADILFQLTDEELAACDARIADIEKSFDTHYHALDFARKLYLIENCIYGVDIQPIAFAA
jgi:hypothetical protein